VRTRKDTERGALTNWSAQSKIEVRTLKVRERERGTHGLGSAGRSTGEHTESKRVSGGCSPPGIAERGTSEDVESERAKGSTHLLENGDRWTSENTDRKRASEGHSLSGVHRATDK
jgi:hypothetical protein